jgi:hypothetical protein
MPRGHYVLGNAMQPTTSTLPFTLEAAKMALTLAAAVVVAILLFRSF